MQKLSILLLFISSISYSQISFYDIKQIDSQESYERIMIENGFEYVEWKEYERALIRYAHNYNEDKNEATIWFFYYFKDNTFHLQTAEAEDYDKIFNEVKRSCTFYGIIEDAAGTRVSSYTCPGSRYPGKISFSKGIIQTIIPK